MSKTEKKKSRTSNRNTFGHVEVKELRDEKEAVPGV